MLKRNLVNEINTHVDGCLKKDLRQAIDIIMDTMSEALSRGQRVEIRGFGSFSVRQRKARVTKNPKTGKTMNIPPRKSLHFTMSKSLKNALVKKEQ